jgi:Na+/H+ antiporter NhaD/arsenite permease-like protein/Tfp pilus assembly protein PilF
MASLSIVRAFTKFEMASLARMMLVALFCASLGAAALGKSDRWPSCRGADPDVRIVGCTEIIARGSRETKRNRITAYINRGSAYRAKGDFNRATADLDKALKLNPKLPLALTERASIYSTKGDPDRAIADYTRALKLDKNLAAAYIGRARAYRGKGDFDKALADFNEALRLNPESASLHLDRGAVYEAKGDLDRAVADYGQAIEQDPKLAIAYNNRGLAFSAKGEFDKALADFSKAAELDPKFADAFLNRAKAYRGKHDLEHACQDLEGALKLDPQLASAKEALDDVNRLTAESAPHPTPAHGSANLPWPLALPFAGMLLSIALGPIVVRQWWHIHYEKAAAFWAILTLGGLAAVTGPSAAAAGFVHSMMHEYLPFILMLFALYTAAGGISVEGKLSGSPLVNTAILAIGSTAASIIGTTGASMILIRPLIRANSSRKFNAPHVVVFFIFLVSNIGGVLTPLGDPPLFLGYLEGVDFFWTTRTLWPETLFAVGVLLAIFFVIDSYIYRRNPPAIKTAARKLRIGGLVNVPLICIAIVAIYASGMWHPGIGFEVLGTRIELQNIIRELVMVLVGLASLRLTSRRIRAVNGFEWEPIREVAYLFAGIFTCIIPVMAMLHAGANGPFSPIIGMLTHGDGTPNNAVYFWTTGLLSSFLDNAPTYLVFFNLASGDPAALMGPLAETLAAISLGAVFLGANTYIGNAPNFMVYAIARRAGVNMPGFFPYMIWAAVILLPVFALVAWLFLT